MVAFILVGYLMIAFGSGAASADDTPSGSETTSSPAGATGAGVGQPSTTATSETTGTTPGTSTATTTAPTVEESTPSDADPTEQPKPTVVERGTVDAVQVTGTLAPTTPPSETTKTIAPEQDSSTAASPTKATTPDLTTPSPTTPNPTTPNPTTASIAPPTTAEVKGHSEPQPPAVAESVALPSATASAPNVRRADVTSNVVPLVAVSPSTPSTVATVPALNPVQFGRQMAGLASDVSIIAISVVHTVADTVAQIVGPNAFLGVPYLLATSLANVAAAAGTSLIGGGSLDTGSGLFPVTYGVLNGLAFFNPTKPPVGANDPNIRVTPEHPLPIILINGTTATQGANFSVGAPVLANAGYKVYTFNYGNTLGDPNSPIQAIGDIRQSGLELSAEIDRVLAETNAPQVILIGHSQGGGILPNYYINNLGGAAKVSQLIGIAPSNHGTDVDSLLHLPIIGPLAVAVAGVIGAAFPQQAIGSPLQDEVYGNGDTRPGVLYTTIATMYDEVVTPYTQQALTGAGVTNIVLQDLYPSMIVGHAGVIVSPILWATVLGALNDNPAANPVQVAETLVA